MSPKYQEQNRAGLVRIRDLTSRLTAEQLEIELGGQWTVSVVFAHLSFWDAWVCAHWDHYEREGKFERIPPTITEFVNAAATRAWLEVPPQQAIEIAIAAAEQVSQRIESLPDALASRALEAKRIRMLDRSLHWNRHLDDIEAAVR